MDRVFLKTGHNPGLSLTIYIPKMKKNTIDGPTAQWPHTGAHNSTGHTPEVHNQVHIKE